MKKILGENGEKKRVWLLSWKINQRIIKGPFEREREREMNRNLY